MPGLYFEQFEVGQRFAHAVHRTVTEHRAYNQRDEEVASCKRAALMMKRPTT